MDWFKIEKLSESNWLRHLWQAYDILYDVQRQCTWVKWEIYGWPDNFRAEIASNKLTVLVASHIGWIIWWLSHHQLASNIVSLDFLWVQGSYRGRWIWGQLIDQLIHNVYLEADTIIRLHCKQDSGVFVFYQKKWFKPSWSKGNKTFIKMELALKWWVN